MQTFSHNLINVRQYQIVENEILGEGAQGTVRKAWCNLIPDRQICAKIIQINNTNQEMWTNELGVMVTMTKNKHRNLVQIIDAFTSEDGKCYIIMEQQDSNLQRDFDERIKINNWYTFDEVARIIRDLSYGLFEIHNNKMIHRDLKPANILIGSCDYMIADFGISQKLDSQIKKNLKFIEGSVKYFCPQIYEKYIKNVKIANYTYKSDIYSLGLIFYQLAFGEQLPWVEDPQQKGQAQKNFLNNINFQVPQVQLVAEPERQEQLRQLIQNMIRQKEEERPSWLELLTHPLVTQQEFVVQMNQTSYTKLIYESLLDQLTATQFIRIKDNYLDNYQINLLKNNQNSLKRLYVIILLQITKSQVAEIQYNYSKRILQKLPEIGQQLTHVGIYSYIGYIYFRLRGICYGQNLTPQDEQFYNDNNLNQDQQDPVFLQIRELINQQYLMVKVLLLNYTEKLLQLIQNSQLINDEYSQIIQANEQGYYQLFQRLISDCLQQYQLDERRIISVTDLLKSKHQDNSKYLIYGLKFKTIILYEVSTKNPILHKFY
ncbi:hypothetical protein pb186bvf_015759 [Paramecium bursaria]